MSWKKLWPKILAASLYIAAHKKQLSAAFALGAGLLEAIQKAT